jgi:RNA polymerase sigma factor (sigma-70 family)
MIGLNKDIWLAITSGDKSAYSEAYVYYYYKLFNYGRKFVTDETLIEDAIQEVMLMLWDKRQNLAGINSPSSYIFYSFRYIVFKKINQLEKSRSQLEIPEPEFSIDQLMVNKEADHQIKVQLTEALNQLTSRQREAIFLRFYEGLGYEEVASVMNISVKAAYKIIARSLLHLKDKIYIPLISILLLLRSLAFWPG